MPRNFGLAYKHQKMDWQNRFAETKRNVISKAVCRPKFSSKVKPRIYKRAVFQALKHCFYYHKEK